MKLSMYPSVYIYIDVLKLQHHIYRNKFGMYNKVTIQNTFRTNAAIYKIQISCSENRCIHLDIMLPNIVLHKKVHCCYILLTANNMDEHSVRKSWQSVTVQS